MSASLTYTDRFGHSWRVRATRASGGGWTFVFVSRGIQLLTADPVPTHPSALTEAALKDLFCDAERVLVSDGETWYVSYRPRASGQRGNARGGLSTRFRSATGDIHFSRDMLDFRHMPASALQESLVATAGIGRAAKVVAAPARRRARKSS